MKTPSLAPACLALFDRETQRAIIAYARSTPESTISADLSRSNPYLPPGIFALASPRFAQDEKNAYHILMGLAYSMIANVKEQEFGKGYYQALLEDLFGLDAGHAGQIADRIETADKASSMLGSAWGVIQEAWNSAMPDRLGLDANAGNQLTDDIDMSFEMLRLGEEIHPLLTRLAMISARITDASPTDATPVVRRLLSTLGRGGDGTGDLISGNPERRVRRMMQNPLPTGDMGPVGSILSGLGTALQSFASSPAGQQAINSVVQQGTNALLSAVGPRPAAPPQAAPMAQAPPLSISTNVTPAQLAAAGAGRPAGGAVCVEVRQ